MNKLTLPNIYNKPDVRTSYNINNREYTFRFKWCGTFCIVDIYVIENSKNNYLVKGRAITLNSDLFARVKNDELVKGSLVLVNIYGNTSEPQQDNFHTDYSLIYYTQEEL